MSSSQVQSPRSEVENGWKRGLFDFRLWTLLFLIVQPAVAADAIPPYAEHQDLSYYLDARAERHPIRTIADWQIRRRHILAHLQEVMGPLPRPAVPVPLDGRTLNETKLGPIVRINIAYHTDSPSRRVIAYLFLPAKPSGKVPAIL